MSSRTRGAVGRMSHVVRMEARRRGAPMEREAPDADTQRSPAIDITQAMIDEWQANDPELRAWREQEARPRLW